MFEYVISFEAPDEISILLEIWTDREKAYQREKELTDRYQEMNPSNDRCYYRVSTLPVKS